MGLSWINPLYLSGLLLVALPVLIHLVQRQHSSGIKFPSLMFLEKIEWREKRRLEIRHWLLLLLRCLLLALIALAFARPFLDAQATPAVLDLQRRDSVIVIDRSYSMRLGDHWQQARQMALQQVDEKNPQDRIGVVMFDDRAEVASGLSANTDNLRSVIKRQSPGHGSTRIIVAIEQAARLLDSSNAPQKQILLLSDFQAGARVAGERPVISSDIELKAVAVKIAPAANATISSIAVESSPRGGEFGLRVELSNHSGTDLEQHLDLALNGRAHPRRQIQLPAGAVVTETYSELNAAEPVRGVVSLGDDALALDNHAYFVHSDRQQVPVLIVEPPAPRPNQSLYLENALKFARNPGFRIRRSSWNALKAEDLSAWAVIIVNDAPLPDAELTAALGNFVANGGGLLLALGETTAGNWPSAEDGFLPGTLSRRVDAKSATAYRLAMLDGEHALSGNPGARDQIDLSAARIFSYRELRANARDRVVGRYDDDGIALLERPGINGKALVLSTTLDAYWNDLALQPAFVPFLHHTLRYLAGFESFPRDFKIGAIVDLMGYARALAGADAIIAAAADSSLVVEPPTAGEFRLDREAALLTIEEPGFYQLHRATPADVEVVLAANVDPAEANPETLDVAGFVEEIRAAARPASTRAQLTRRQATEHEQQQQLWHLVLLLVLAVMMAEAFFANWISVRRSIRA